MRRFEPRLYNRSTMKRAPLLVLAALFFAGLLPVPSRLDQLSVASLGPWLPTEPPPPVTLPAGIHVRAGSWNLYGGNWANAATIGAALAPLGLDVVGLQEDPSAAFTADVAAAAGLAFSYYGDHGEAILSRTPLTQAEWFTLATGRTFARAHTTIGGVDFAIYSVHTDWNVDGNRDCRELVDSYLSVDPTPYKIVVGDFNDEHFSDQITMLEEVLTDSWTKLGWYPGQRVSWPSKRFDGSEGSQLIDLIFTNTSAGAIVVTGDVVNLTPVPSDHKPVWAELLFSANPSAPFTEDPFADQRRPDYGFPPPASRPANLLANPGFESNLASWSGEGGMTATSARENQVAHGGSLFATGQGGCSGTRSKARQTVSLASQASAIDQGRGQLLVSGWMTTGYQTISDANGSSNQVRPYDEAEIRVELKDGAGKLLGVEASSRRDTLDWSPYYATIHVPPGTRSATMVLTSTRNYVNLLSNDAMFDDVYLGFEALAAPHELLAGNLLVNPEAESGNTSGWTVTGSLAAFADMNLETDVYPLKSASGDWFFITGLGNGAAAALTQDVDLSSHAGRIDLDQLSIRWGGSLRSYESLAAVGLAVEFLDAGNGSLGGATIGPSAAAEWTPYQRKDAVPPGTRKVRFTASYAGGAADQGLFDLLYLATVQR